MDRIRLNTPDAPSSEIAPELFELYETLQPGASAQAYRCIWDSTEGKFFKTDMQEEIHDWKNNDGTDEVGGHNFGLVGERFYARYNPILDKYIIVGSKGLMRHAIAAAEIAFGVSGNVLVYGTPNLTSSGEIIVAYNTWGGGTVSAAAKVYIRYFPQVGFWFVMPDQSGGGVIYNPKIEWIRAHGSDYTTNNDNYIVWSFAKTSDSDMVKLDQQDNPKDLLKILIAGDYIFHMRVAHTGNNNGGKWTVALRKNTGAGLTDVQSVSSANAGEESKALSWLLNSVAANTWFGVQIRYNDDGAGGSNQFAVQLHVLRIGAATSGSNIVEV